MLYVDIKKRLKGFDLNVQLEVESGRIGILGASGSGKSMTLKMIAGIEKPDEGIIILGDRVLFNSKKRIHLPVRERKVGYVFQNYALFPQMNVTQNIVSGIGKMSKEEKQRVGEEMIRKLRLEGLEKRLPRELSGGEAQRVAIGRMLATKPEILMFDEPFSALDYHLRDQMQEQLIKVLEQQKVASLFVSHDIDEVYRLCHKIAVMNRGEVERFGSKADIFENPKRLSAAQLTGCKNISKAKKLSKHRVFALDWGVELEIPETEEKFEYIGIRAHHIKSSCEKKENTFDYHLSTSSETRFGKTIFFNLQVEKALSEDTLRLDVDKEWWASKKRGNELKYMTLPKERLLTLSR